jgi:chromosome partitioning protein
MQTLCFSNNKGGVGKTTSALNVGLALARRGYRVLFCDCDPQRSLTISFEGTDVPEHVGMRKGEFSLDDIHAVIRPVGENMDLLPASGEMEANEAQLPGWDAEHSTRLADILEMIAPEYDYCVIDTKGSIGTLTWIALSASNLLYIPVDPEFYGFEGLTNLINTCTRLKRRINPSLRIGGIFFTKYSPTYRSRLRHDVVDLIKEHYGKDVPVFETTIRQSTAIPNSQMAGTGLFDYAPDSTGAEDYEALTTEILHHLSHGH